MSPVCLGQGRGERAGPPHSGAQSGKASRRRGPVISILKKERDIIRSKWSRIPGCKQAALAGTEMGKWVLLPGSV